MTDRPTDQVNYIMEPYLYRESLPKNKKSTILIEIIKLQRYRHTDEVNYKVDLLLKIVLIKKTSA